MIELGKYKTRSGLNVRVIETNFLGNSLCPVVAIIEDICFGEIIRYYTASGKMSDKQEHSLDIVIPTPWDDFQIDEPVLVKDGPNQTWFRRYFAGVEDGSPTTWRDRGTSWSSEGGDKVYWKYCIRSPD